MAVSVAFGQQSDVAGTHRVWIQLAVVGLVIAAVFISLYVGLQRSPSPEHLPLAVVGAALAHGVEGDLGRSVSVRTVATESDADDLIRHRDVVGSIAVSPSGLQLRYAGANGLSEKSAVTSLSTGIAKQLKLPLASTDIVPLSRFDSRGLVSFYVSFGVTLTSFILGQGLTMARGRLRRRHHPLAVAVFAVSVGLVAATIAGPVYGAVPAPFFPLAAALMLLSLATSLTTMALGAWFGAIGLSAAVLLLTTTGNATSAATIGVDLLPGWARLLSDALPPGAAVKLITNLGYFQGSHILTAVLVLIAWAIAAAAAVGLKDHARPQDQRAGKPPASEASPPAEEPAVTAAGNSRRAHRLKEERS